LCSAGAGGVTGEGEGITYTFAKGAGWCSSDLDEQPAALISTSWFDADTCWNACIADYGAETIHNVQYDCDNYGCECYCQSSCPCMVQVGSTSTLFAIADSTIPGSCYDDDDDYNDSVEGEYYFCSCSGMYTDETTCTDNLGADAWSVVPCYMLDWYINYPYWMCSYNPFGSADMALYVDRCCTTGMNGCTGVCISSTSSVKAITGANPVAHPLPITELKAGDKVLAATHEGKQLYDEVEAVLHGPHAENFVELKIKGTSNLLRATPHHTFPACSHKDMTVTTKSAKSFSAGDCIMTPSGKATVSSAMHVPAAKGEEAFTVVLKGKTDLLAVNDVFTHALPEAKKEAKKKQLRGNAGNAAARPERTGFQVHVTDAVDYKLKALAKKHVEA